jgi:hypothetical protein
MEGLFPCCCFAFFIIISIISNLSKLSSNNSVDDSSSSNPNLDDIFKDIQKFSGQTGSSNTPSTFLPSKKFRKNDSAKQIAAPSKPTKQTSSVSLTPTVHTDHNCDDVNFDSLPSLEGGTGSFNLTSEPIAKYSRDDTQINFGREDLVKSFIMSEVLQRYDINRIYSRIPSVKSDD